MTAKYVLAFFGIMWIFAFRIATTAKPTVRSGPYVAILTRLEKCDKPSSSYLQNPPFKALIGKNVKKKNHIKGHFSILREISNVKINVQNFYWEGGKWQMSFSLKNLSCRSHFASDLLDFMAIVYDKKNCKMPKGTYSFEVDFDKLEHIWMVNREYGRVLRRVEVFIGRGTALCLEFENDVRPL